MEKISDVFQILRNSQINKFHSEIFVFGFNKFGANPISLSPKNSQLNDDAFHD